MQDRPPQRIAQEIMRHSDMRLTNQVYTDPSFLETREAISHFPSFLGKRNEKCPPICPLKIVPNSLFVSIIDKSNTRLSDLQVSCNECDSHELPRGDSEREMVGARGFEPPASASRTQRSSQAEPRPENVHGIHETYNVIHTQR